MDPLEKLWFKAIKSDTYRFPGSGGSILCKSEDTGRRITERKHTGLSAWNKSWIADDFAARRAPASTRFKAFHQNLCLFDPTWRITRVYHPLQNRLAHCVYFRGAIRRGDEIQRKEGERHHATGEYATAGSTVHGRLYQFDRRAKGRTY